MENKKQTLKARETIDKEYVEKLPLEDLVKVAGGVSSNTYKCPFCGMEFEKFGNILSEMEMKWHMAQHLLEENTPEQAFSCLRYGMFFRYMPELEWRCGYLAVFVLSVAVIVCCLILFKRKKWL